MRTQAIGQNPSWGSTVACTAGGEVVQKRLEPVADSLEHAPKAKVLVDFRRNFSDTHLYVNIYADVHIDAMFTTDAISKRFPRNLCRYRPGATHTLKPDARAQ